jgi:hypothetical protein
MYYKKRYTENNSNYEKLSKYLLNAAWPCDGQTASVQSFLPNV